MEINNRKVETVKEIGTVDIDKLRKKLKSIEVHDWDTPEDFQVNYNKSLEGLRGVKTKALALTKHITFKFADKRNTSIRYIECSRWQEWKETLMPIMNEVAHYLGYTTPFFPKAMLANLPAKSFIPPHIDGDEKGHVPHKIHIPVQTNEACFFYIEDQKFHFREGVAYEVNNGKRHSVINNGESDRIHFIFECLDINQQSKTIQERMLNPTKR